jgi:hypothetical protein
VAEPATVIKLGRGTHLTKVWLQDTISRFKSDDVWSNEFLKNVVFHYFGEEEPVLTQELQATLDHWGTTRTYLARHNDSLMGEGPYFLHMGKVHPAYRLYPDTAGAFMVGTVPSDSPFR